MNFEQKEIEDEELRTLVYQIFDVEKEGQINQALLISLRRLKITHPKWVAAMDAITDSIRVVGSKAYIRLYKRPTPQDGWEMVQLNIASV